jgi:peptidoglycan hydrolase-like protein with peptidoglycan-binding domain
MNKALLTLLVVIVFALSTSDVSASTGMTAEQLRAEIARLTKVADTIRAKLAELGATEGTLTTSACLKSNLRMKMGDSGQSVYALQNFLVESGVYSPSLVTGYFGPATEAGVQRWQALHGVINYGTPATTGYGLVGPSTLRAMHRGCPGGVYNGPSGTLTRSGGSTGTTPPSVSIVPVEKYSLSVNPTKGLYPLAVTASFSITGSTCTSYLLDWGDGSPAISYDSNTSINCRERPINITRSHVYNRYGNYTIIFKTGKAPLSKIKTVNTINIESLPSL